MSIQQYVNYFYLFRALKSHTLHMIFTQVNAILCPHNETIISRTFKFFYLNSSFWDRKLLQVHVCNQPIWELNSSFLMVTFLLRIMENMS